MPGNVPMVSGTYAKGQLLGRLTSGGKFTTYNSAQSDGSQVARVIAQYDMTVDSSGNVTIGANHRVVADPTDRAGVFQRVFSLRRHPESDLRRRE